MRRIFVFLTIFAFSAVMFMGCGAKEEKPVTGLENAPKWVIMGSAAFPGDAGRAFYGVGSAPKMRDRSMQRTRAQMRATDDLAGQMETYISSLKKDYSASISDGDAESIEDTFEVVRKQVTAQTLSGVQLSEVWIDKANGEMFVLVKLDLVNFTNSIEKAKELNSKVKDYIKQNAEKMHDELRAEEEKRQ